MIHFTIKRQLLTIKPKPCTLLDEMLGGIVLADSNITKRALAEALKHLLSEQPFEKISVGSICNECGLNRKSFYYHFKDKYELVNWIYDTEFLENILKKDFHDSWELIEEFCKYLYENREFYKKTFQTEGQNSFSDYFSSIIYSVLYEHLEDIYKQEPHIDRYVEFYTDTFVCSIKKWINRKDCMPAQEFSDFLKSAILLLSERAYQLYRSGHSS